MSGPDQQGPWNKSEKGHIWCYYDKAPADVKALFPAGTDGKPTEGRKTLGEYGYSLKIYENSIKIFRYSANRGGKGKSFRVTLKRLIPCRDITEANNMLGQLQGIVGCVHTDGAKFVLGVYEEVKDQ